MGSPRNPHESEEIPLKPKKYPALSMRAKWAIFILSVWTFMGISYLTAYDEITSTLHVLEQGTSLNETQNPPDETGSKSTSAVTILLDDFDDPEIYNLWEKGESGTGTIAFRDGFAFLNTTDQTKADNTADGEGNTRAKLWHKNSNPYRYAGVEIRLRCSDDNKMESDIGGGWRVWGFWDYQAVHALYFSCASPESHPEKAGLRAQSTVGSIEKLSEPITGIDIREWHIYTIIWEPRNATFLVDGEVVAYTDQVPIYNMDAVVSNTNRILPFDSFSYKDYSWFSYMDVPFNQSIQVDYIHVFNFTELPR
jgi:hypothetical protein